MIKKQTKELRVASCELRENVTAALTRNAFIVGIDLGTTNSAVMSIDLSAGVGEIESFPLFQKTAPGESDNRLTLPSFLFIEPSGDVEVGAYARDFGALQPGRLIWSAKSWLCHSQVDRTAAFLPWKASDDVKKMSPVDAQSQYLKFIADRWNDAHPNAPLDKQDIVITLPASFDETARQLTIRAAAKAGLNKVVLIEEPQAAFYAWIYKNSELGMRNAEAAQSASHNLLATRTDRVGSQLEASSAENSFFGGKTPSSRPCGSAPQLATYFVIVHFWQFPQKTTDAGTNTTKRGSRYFLSTA